jgi:tRNA-2-methylthio-N6-dimethylallyladenosine synthase
MATPRASRSCGKKKPVLYIKTFGCQMNDRDSEALAGLFRDAGYELADSKEGADVILFNTCSVRQHAEDKVWSELGKLKTRRTAEQTNSQGRQDSKPIIGIIGCMAQNYKQEIFKRAPYVDLVAGPNDLLSVPLLVKQIEKERIHALAVSTMEREQNLYVSDYRQRSDHAYVVISEGCSNFCSYCVVPFVRGRLHSRPYREILDEIKRTVDSEIKKITLLGQNVNSYEDNNVNFVKLLEMVNSVEGVGEFDFVTSHPKDVPEELFFAMRDLGKCRKFLHLPIQSGSDRILMLMNRGYTRAHYLGLIERYRKIVGGILSTDVIVGFPTEKEIDFKDTEDLLKTVEFDFAYIFKYSVRPHTQAEKLKDDVPKEEKERRHQSLLNLQKEISRRKRCVEERP